MFLPVWRDLRMIFQNKHDNLQRALTTADSNSRNAHVDALCKSMAKGEAKLRPIGEQRRSASSADVGQEVDSIDL